MHYLISELLDFKWPSPPTPFQSSAFLSNLPHKMLQHISQDCFLLLQNFFENVGFATHYCVVRVINVLAVAVQGQQIFSGCSNVVTGKWSMIKYHSQGSASVMKQELQTDCLLGGSMLMSRLFPLVTEILWKGRIRHTLLRSACH